MDTSHAGLRSLPESLFVNFLNRVRIYRVTLTLEINTTLRDRFGRVADINGCSPVLSLQE